MARKAWRTPIPGFLLLLATYSEGSVADAGDRFFFASTLVAAGPTAADSYYPLYFVRLPGTNTTNGIDAPIADSALVSLAIFFTKTFRALATDQNRTSREWS